MHNPRLYVWLCAFLAAISSLLAAPRTTAAKEFAVRQITNFTNVDLREAVIPVGVVDGELLFYGYDNNQGGYYRTDGNAVVRIDNPLSAMAPLGEPAQLGNELYFSARGDHGAELFALNGQGIRQVADLNQGPADTPIREIHTINGQLVFGAGTPQGLRLHRSDGFVVERFPEPTAFTADGAVQLGNKLLFNSFQPYSTDGFTANLIEAPQTQPNLGIVTVGEHAYFATINGQVFRTDGATAIPVAQAPASIVSIFELNGAAHFASFSDYPKTDLSFFRIENDSAVKLLDWPVPDDVNLRPWPSDQQPILVTSDGAYFSYTRRGRYELYKYDGDSFDLISEQFFGPTERDRIVAVNGRVFINLPAGSGLLDFELAEEIEGELVQVGPGLRSITSHDGHLFAVSKRRTPSSENNFVWQYVNDEFVVLADIPASEGSFLEFDGKLYFGGQYDYHGRGSSTIQLYEIASVPEPTACAIAVPIVALGMLRRRSRSDCQLEVPRAQFSDYGRWSAPR